MDDDIVHGVYPWRVRLAFALFFAIVAGLLGVFWYGVIAWLF